MSPLSLAVDNGETAPMVASNGARVTVNEDGSVSIEPAEAPKPRINPGIGKFDANLAEGLEDGVRMNIANDYLDGVAADILSRTDFISNYNLGIDLLGLKLDPPGTTRGTRTSISKVKNPALLKACVRSQSLSRSQLLPAAGPCKVQTISGESDGEDALAQHFQQDFNHYLTNVDHAYYADVVKGLFYRAFGGSVYRKCYFDPIRKMPVSRFVPLESFIISEDVSDLHDALRKTHEIFYNSVQVKRMQQAGAWLDVPLGTPMQTTNPARLKTLQSQGLSAATLRPDDQQRTIYEGFVYLSPADYGFDEPECDDPERPLPYRVTVDKDSRQMLAMHRNWKKGDPAFSERQVFVKYGLVSGLGFLDYGFLHLIGNQTRVLTAIWQILVDKGMLSNFPGGFITKGVRTATNELNPGLGEWVKVDLGSIDDIRKAMMGSPYGEISQIFIQLMEVIQQDVESLAGTLDIPTGEGTSNTPVGTILALVEQQSQDLTAVQQNDHRAQKEELRLLRDLFIDHPESLRLIQRPGSDRSWKDLIDEFSDMDLVPASDPNVPSQAHRILINQFVMQMAQAAPELFGSRLQKLAKRILQGIGWNDADDYLAPPQEFMQSLQASRQPKGKGNSGAGQASVAKAQMELPLKQQELAIESKRVDLEEQDMRRQAANEAGDQTLRRQRQEAELAHDQAQLEHDKNQLAADTAESSPDAQDAADLALTRAKEFQAIGVGAQGFAKANETVAEGQRAAEAIEQGATPPPTSLATATPTAPLPEIPPSLDRRPKKGK